MQSLGLSINVMESFTHCSVGDPKYSPCSHPRAIFLGMGEREVASLESLQNRILERIRFLESSLAFHESNNGLSQLALSQQQQLQQPDATTKNDEEELSLEDKLGRLLLTAGVTFFQFKRVPPDYYDRSFEERRDLLGAASIDHLCKSIVMVNTQAHESVKDCSDYNNSKFYMVIVQYTARLNAEKVKQFVYSLNNGKIPKKRFNLRLAPEDEAYRLTGFSHNAVTPVGTRTPLPIILSNAIPKLQPQFFWLGGGEVDLKLGINTQQFINMFKPFIAECS